MEWNNITQISQLDGLNDESQTKKIVIFKHSTRCGVSKMVLKKFEQEITELNKDEFSFYFLDLIRFRDISNQIASKWNTIHQSPQLIVISSNKVVHSASHFSINGNALIA